MGYILRIIVMEILFTYVLRWATVISKLLYGGVKNKKINVYWILSQDTI